MPTTIDDHSDLAERSDDELFDILTHVDPHEAPGRYRALRAEFVRRHGAVVRGQTVDAYLERIRRKRPLAERSRFRKRVLIALALWALAMLLVRAILFVRTRL